MELESDDKLSDTFQEHFFLNVSLDVDHIDRDRAVFVLEAVVRSNNSLSNALLKKMIQSGAFELLNKLIQAGLDLSNEQVDLKSFYPQCFKTLQYHITNRKFWK